MTNPKSKLFADVERKSDPVNKIDTLTQKINHFVSYLILPMVLITFLIVVLRYTIGFGKVWLQELVIYFHATFFVFGIAYNFLKNSHVRVDVFYSKMSESKKAKIDFFGILFFVWPSMGLIFFKSLPYVEQSFRFLESSPDAGGLPARFLLKSLIPILCLLVILQTISMAFKCLSKMNLRGQQ